MFDKFKERIAKLEETNETFRDAKAHVEKYQVVYACGITSVVCIIVTRAVSTRPMEVTTIIEAPSISPVFNNQPVFEIANHLANNAGHCTKVVQDLETGELWSKAGELAHELAEEHGITYDAARTMLSRHLNGKRDQVFGKIYRTIALGTTG
jgi:hypothetical protein